MKRETARNFGILSAAFLALFSLPVLLPALLTQRLPVVLTDLVPVFPAAALGLLALFLVQTVVLFWLMRECKTLPPSKPKFRLAVTVSLALMAGSAAGALAGPGGTVFFGTWAVHGFLLYQVFLALLLWKRLPEAPPHWVGVVCCICAGCFALYIVAVWGARMMLDRRAIADDEAARAAGSVQSWQELAERYYHGEKPDPDLDRLFQLCFIQGAQAELHFLWDKLLTKPGPLKSTRLYDERTLFTGHGGTVFTLLFLREEKEVFPELLKQEKTEAALLRWKQLGDWLDTTVADSQEDELFTRSVWLDITKLLLRSGKLSAEQKAEMAQRLNRSEKVHAGSFQRALYPELFLLAARTEFYLRTGGDVPRDFQRKRPLLGSFAAFPAYAAIMLRRSQTMRLLIAAVQDPDTFLPEERMFWLRTGSPVFSDSRKIWKNMQKKFQIEGEKP